MYFHISCNLRLNNLSTDLCPILSLSGSHSHKEFSYFCMSFELYLVQFVKNEAMIPKIIIQNKKRKSNNILYNIRP